MSFTLFVTLPKDDVCTLRNVTSGTSIRSVRKQLELTAGLPAQTYRLVAQTGAQGQGQVLHEDHVLRLDSNVWDGFVLRAAFLDSWQDLYDRLVANDITHVIKHGAVSMRNDVVWASKEEELRAREVMEERGVVALFVASFLGMVDMCRALLSAGVKANGKTPFGRTPLFAALSRDNDHVMELLISHNASLETCDVDGVTAVDVGRRLPAKQCMRKVRHVQLQSKSENFRTVSQGLDRKKLGRRVIRVPSGQREHAPSNGRPPTVKLFQDDASERSGSHTTEAEPASARPWRQHTASRNQLCPQQQSGGTSNRQRTNKDSADTFLWDNHQQGNVSRSPSAAGTQVRAPIPSMASRGASRAGVAKGGVTWSDTTSVASGMSRMLALRPSVYDISAVSANKVTSHVLLTTASAASSSVSSFAPYTGFHGVVDLRESESRAGRHRPGPSPVLLKYYTASNPAQPHPPMSRHHHHSGDGGEEQEFSELEEDELAEPHVPAQEPPGRPPTRLENPGQKPDGEEDTHQYPGSSAGNASLVGSQGDLSACSAPDFAARGGDTALGEGLESACQGDSDDDGGRVLSSRGKGPGASSQRMRKRLLVSRQRQQESWRTMKRRIKLAEDQKRTTQPTTTTATTTTTTLTPLPNGKSGDRGKGSATKKENFEQWLERKRQEHSRNLTSSDEETSDDENYYRSGENPQAFNDWLRDLKERPLRRPHTSTPASLHRRKSRPLKDLIQVGGSTDNSVPRPDPDSYMTVYREWQHRKTKNGDLRRQDSITDIKEAKIQLEEKRKEMLAMALTYEDWLEHAEERKKLMQAILRADMEQLNQLEHEVFRTRRAPKQISFTQWREKVDKKEAEMRQQRHRMRREAELRHQNGGGGTGTYLGDGARSTLAAAHEEWVRKRREEALRNRGNGHGQHTTPRSNHSHSRDGSVDEGYQQMSEGEKQAAWETWLEQKHKQDVAQLDRHLRQERQLLLNAREKKPFTVTQC